MAGAAGARTKQLALATAILASAIAAVDSTAVNVALPAISRDLGGGWPPSSGCPTPTCSRSSSLILVAGSLTDLYGERRVFSIGVGGFGICSALCAASPTISVLIAARALQGVFGALLTPSALAGHHRRRLPQGRARRRDRLVDRLGRNLDRGRAAHRRVARRRPPPGAGSSSSTYRW
jgi:MFS family permease